jgi:hypothetical protein
VRERQPHDVAVLDRHRLEAVEEAPVGAVVSEQIEAGVDDAGGEGLELVEERLHGRAKTVALVGDRRRRNTGEREEVRVLVRVELQRPRDRVEHLRRGMNVPALLEPRVPGDADASELGHFLASQPGSATAPRRREADMLRSQALPAAAEEGAELAAPELAAVAPCSPVARCRLDEDLGTHAAFSMAKGSRVRRVALIPG